MRVSRIAKTEVAAAAQPVWDFIAGSRGEVRGPYQVLIRVPSLADAVAKLGSYFRFGDSLLSDAEREFATLATGRACGAVYEWLMHEPIARRVGTRPQAIDLLERDAPPEQFEPREAIIVESARALVRTHRPRRGPLPARDRDVRRERSRRAGNADRLLRDDRKRSRGLRRHRPVTLSVRLPSAPGRRSSARSCCGIPRKPASSRA